MTARYFRGAHGVTTMRMIMASKILPSHHQEKAKSSHVFIVTTETIQNICYLHKKLVVHARYFHSSIRVRLDFLSTRLEFKFVIVFNSSSRFDSSIAHYCFKINKI
jgi:hypothetical protein